MRLEFQVLCARRRWPESWTGRSNRELERGSLRRFRRDGGPRTRATRRGKVRRQEKEDAGASANKKKSRRRAGGGAKPTVGLPLPEKAVGSVGCQSHRNPARLPRAVWIEHPGKVHPRC